jgi:hypothetical protein
MRLKLLLIGLSILVVLAGCNTGESGETNNNGEPVETLNNGEPSETTNGGESDETESDNDESNQPGNSSENSPPQVDAGNDWSIYHSDDYDDLIFDDEITASSIENEIADRLAAENSVIITFPAGTYLLEETVDFELEKGQSLIFEGAGINETFFVNGCGVQFRQSRAGGEYVRFTKISFISDPGGSSVKAIQLRSPGDFRIDHCYFNGRWHGMIDIIRSGNDIGDFIQKGLIDHIDAVNSKDPQGYYGIQITPKYQPGDMDDETFWSTFWNEHFNTVLGTEESVFVEDSTFTNFHTSVITNWASFGKITVRHNTLLP